MPDSNHLLGQRWHFVGSFVGPTSTNDISPMSFCSSGQLNCQPLVRCWSNACRPTSPAYANVMPTILFQVLRWANVSRHDLILIVQRYLIFLKLGVIGYNNVFLDVLEWHAFSIYRNKLVLYIK